MLPSLICKSELVLSSFERREETARSRKRSFYSPFLVKSERNLIKIKKKHTLFIPINLFHQIYEKFCLFLHYMELNQYIFLFFMNFNEK